MRPELLLPSSIELREFGARASSASHDSADYDTTNRRSRSRDTEAPMSSSGDIRLYYSVANVAHLPESNDGSCRCLEEARRRFIYELLQPGTLHDRVICYGRT